MLMLQNARRRGRHVAWHADCSVVQQQEECAMRCSAVLAGVWVFGVSGLVLANPIMAVDEAYAQQYPSTGHVQLTRISSSSALGALEITRDGQPVTADVQSAAGPSRDLGSGMTTLAAAVACDCDVPFGHHSYVVGGIAVEIDVIDASAANTAVPEPSALCDVACAASVPVPPGTGGSAGDGSGGAAPTGGAATGGGAGDDSEGAAASAGMAPMAETPDEGSSSSGCAISRNARSLVPLGVGMALGLLAWRRKE
jgi:hypothetical protein